MLRAGVVRSNFGTVLCGQHSPLHAAPHTRRRVFQIARSSIEKFDAEVRAYQAQYVFSTVSSSIAGPTAAATFIEMSCRPSP